MLLVSPGRRASGGAPPTASCGQANARHLDLGEYMAVSSDPTPTTVFLEDSAALVGVTLALVALVLTCDRVGGVERAAGLLLGCCDHGGLRAHAPQQHLVDRWGGPADIREQ